MTNIDQTFLNIKSDSQFPLENLPFGVFSDGRDPEPRVGVAVGDYVFDLRGAEERGLLNSDLIRRERPFAEPTLNRFMALGKGCWREVRASVQKVLSGPGAGLESLLCRQDEVTMHLPALTRGYTDFYCSKEHATNLGTMLRGPENALNPNWVYIPIGYDGRASALVPSGTPIKRPQGQVRPNDNEPPQFGPSRVMDFELEMAFFVGPGNKQGEPIPIAKTADHIFGVVLLNDWSARDIQKWEYQPLGPFLGKNFATSISPWVVTLDALEPFRVEAPKQDPAPFPYLAQNGKNAYDIKLEVLLKTSKMRVPEIICRSNHRYLYWTIFQMLAHHTSNGCPVEPGDLMGSGTISGPTPDSLGSMIELSWRGTKPLKLSSGEERKFLEDGDTVILRAYGEREGFKIGFGEVSGTILPSA